MTRPSSDIEIDTTRQPQSAPPSQPALPPREATGETTEGTGMFTKFKRLFGRDQPAGPAPPGPGAQAEFEERRATSKGPQLFSLLVDHSGSMEEGSKAQEATRVLREVINYAKKVNSDGDSTGNKTYLYTQVVLFADRLDDITDGMMRPPADFTPEHVFTVRHPDHRERLGNLTNYQAPLAHVYKTLTGKKGMTKERQEVGMPAPIVLFISDGKPNLPDPVAKARQLALQEAEKIKSLVLPQVKVFHPNMEEIWHPATNVRLVTIGLGTDKELDQVLLQQMCSRVTYQGKELPLYLHCPRDEDLYTIGAKIFGTFKVPLENEKRKSLECVISELQEGPLGRRS